MLPCAKGEGSRSVALGLWANKRREEREQEREERESGRGCAVPYGRKSMGVDCQGGWVENFLWHIAGPRLFASLSYLHSFLGRFRSTPPRLLL